MKKLLALCITFAAAALLAAAPTPNTPRPMRVNGWCADSDAHTDYALTELRGVNNSVTHADSFRRSKGKLPTVRSSEITFVTDTAICRRAAEAIRKSADGADTVPLRTVALFRWGRTRYRLR